MSSDIPEPRAPQGPSSEEINRITPDPYLVPFGAANQYFTEITTALPAKVAFLGSAPQRSIRRISIR